MCSTQMIDCDLSNFERLAKTTDFQSTQEHEFQQTQ
jgi:hypothetical protein